MAPEKTGDLSYRYSQDQVTKLWMASVAATGDECFGLKVAQHVRPSTFHVVGYAMACSRNLRRAAERFANSARLISDSAVVTFHQQGEQCILTADLNTGGRQPIYQTIDTILAGFVLLCRWISSQHIVPISVTFRHSSPPNPEAYLETFGCDVVFDAPTNAIIFDCGDLDREIASSNEDLATMLDEMTTNYLALRYNRRFSRKVRDTLLVQISEGEPKKTITAKMLGMTERTLLRRLREENTTYQELLDRVRGEQAIAYLKEATLNIEEISDRLGFSSSSTFSRAFFRWYGLRPSEWRERQWRG